MSPCKSTHYCHVFIVRQPLRLPEEQEVLEVGRVLVGELRRRRHHHHAATNVFSGGFNSIYIYIYASCCLRRIQLYRVLPWIMWTKLDEIHGRNIGMKNTNFFHFTVLMGRIYIGRRTIYLSISLMNIWEKVVITFFQCVKLESTFPLPCTIKGRRMCQFFLGDYFCTKIQTTFHT
jgi:hypothetical protein